MSEEVLALGIDVGMSGARAAVVDGAGRLLGSGRHPCRHRPTGRHAVEHDARAWVDEAVSAARAALVSADTTRVDVIGVGALGPAPVLVDDDLEPLAPAPLFALDARAESYRAEAASAAGVDELGVDHVLPRLLWWRREMPDVTDRARWVLDATGFIVSTMVGEPIMDRATAVDHVVEGASASVDTPNLREPLELAGALTPAAAVALGLEPGTAVAVGTYDTFVDLWALGVSEPGNVGLLMGSTQALGRVGDGAEVPPGLRAVPHVGEGWFVGGWTSAAGTILDWLAAFVGRDRAELAAEAGSLAPGAGGLVALPYFDGERAPVWDTAARGAIVGLTTATSPAEVYRCLVDALALAARDLHQRLGSPASLRAAGGGTRNETWLGATVDALGTPVDAAPGLADGLGPAFLALAAAGHPRPDPLLRTVEPDPRRHDAYRTLWEVYAGLYDDLAPRLHALGRIAEESR